MTERDHHAEGTKAEAEQPIPERAVERQNVFISAHPHAGGADVKAAVFVARGNERKVTVAAADEKQWIARHMPHVARMVAAATGAKERTR